MENIYNFLKIIYIAVVIVFTILVGSYVTEKSGLSGIMGGSQNLADKGIKKMTKQEIITNWATRLAILFFIISFLLFVMSSNLFKGF
jgi:preprotein translocase subunit SecG